MKKIVSLAMVGMMAMSTIPTVFALPGVTVTCPTHGETEGEYLTTCGHYICPECGYCSDCKDDVQSQPDTPSTIPEVGTTTVTLVGSQEAVGSYYEVEVPATMAPGDTATVTVEGTWKSSETLKVTAPEKVTLYNGDQSMDVAVEFTGINQAGNDKGNSSATGTLEIADASATFGTWTGVIEYTVDLV